MTTVPVNLVEDARRNLRLFIKTAGFLSEIDRQSAFNCVEVLEAAEARAFEAGAKAMREQGQREGREDVLSWLRERGAMKPPAVLHHAAAILADQFEQSNQPAALDPAQIAGGGE